MKQIWKAVLRRIRAHSFLQAVGILVSGTASAQAIAILALPLITRLYTPGDFSVLAVYTSALTIVAGSACLGLNMAIPLPKSTKDILGLFTLSFLAVLSVSVISGIIFYLAPDNLIKTLGLKPIAPYIWLLPIGIFLAGIYFALQSLAIKNKEYTAISRTRITQSLSSVIIQLMMGLIFASPIGLIAGQIANRGGGNLFLFKKLSKKFNCSLLLSCPTHRLKRLLIIYRRFPQFTTFETLANNIGIHVPILIIAATALGPEAGFLALASRIIQMPMGLIGNSISQVFLSKAPDEAHKRTLPQFTIGILITLAKIGVGPIIFLGIIAPDAFSLLFGNEWRRAGTLVSWMTPWFALQFLASPISTSMHVQRAQRSMLALTLTGLSIRVGVILIVSKLHPLWIAESYAISGFIFYLICYIVFSRTAGINYKDLWHPFKKSFPSLLAWTLIGVISLSLLRLFS